MLSLVRTFLEHSLQNGIPILVGSFISYLPSICCGGCGKPPYIDNRGYKDKSPLPRVINFTLSRRLKFAVGS
jgi:hypothetical protein